MICSSLILLHAEEPVTNDKDAIWQMAERVVEALGIELLEATWIGSLSQRTLRLVVDQNDGVSADTCAMICRQFDLTWEAEHEEPRDFGFEATSPGPNRPLTTERDFRRVAGKWVEVTYSDTDGDRASAVAQVGSVENGTLTLLGFDDPVQVLIDDIEEAKIIFTIGKPPTPKHTVERRSRG
jgi:ribosome maturation factor RimP